MSAPAPRTSITEPEKPGLRFGRVAEEYERVRPTYPATLVDESLSRAGLGPGDTVVEIGCGTGKLTRALVERRLRVEAVEPDGELIAVARRIVPEGSVRFQQARFEDAELPEEAFPAAFAATSFHWIDPALGWRKVASLLRQDGVFALFSHVGGTRSPMDAELLQVWHDVSPDSRRWNPVDDEAVWSGVDNRLGNVSELWSWLTSHDLARPEAATLFRDVELAREPYELTLPAEDFLARLRTSNSYLHLSSEDRQRLEGGLTAVLERHGGAYPAKGFGTLVTARRA